MGTDNEAPTRLVRVSAAAWQLAESQGRTARNDGASTPPDAAVRQELIDADVAVDGAVTPAWRQAFDVLDAPQVVLRITAVHEGISGQSAISIAGPRVVCVNRRRSVETTSDGGLRITGREPAVEVSLFALDTFWDGVRRILPPLPQLRAGAAEATSVLEAGDGVGQAEALEVAAQNTAQVTAELATVDDDGGRKVWAGMWAVHEDQLYSIRTRSEGDAARAVVVPVQAGHLAREVGFALVGALDASAAQDGAA